MKKIMFNDKYGLTQAVLKGRKTQTRRMPFGGNLGLISLPPRQLIAAAKYNIGEEVAIAQRYEDMAKDDDFFRFLQKKGIGLGRLIYEKGCHNKMFVKADLMPHRIRITNIRVERLQDISEEDCLEEGIWTRSGKWYCYDIIKRGMESYDPYPDPREAYSVLIDRISGKGTWESNPWVFVYDFELVK